MIVNSLAVKHLRDGLRLLGVFICVALFYVSSAVAAEAATLAVSPATGVYGAGSTFTARVVVNTGGQSVNAAEGTLTFNPKELSVVSVNRSGSIFSLWVTEPAFSNSAGTISFSGGLPSGYSGSVGTIMNVTFRVVGSGSAKVNFKNGSVLANDGKGSNILTAMSGGTYTLQAAQLVPEAEVIVEYVAPANTPGAPQISSATHPKPTGWFAQSEAVLTWTLPAGITAVRTLLDDAPSSIPTKVYDTPIRTITLADLPEGVSYFHLQFKNEDGWGKVAHYRLGVDTEKPTAITIENPAGANLANPTQELRVTVEDMTPVLTFKVKVDDAQPFEFTKEMASSSIILPALAPGYHTIIIEAFDAAGNSIIGTHSITVESFTKPVFTEYPSEINEEVIPVIKGLTRPNAAVELSLTKVGSEPVVYIISSDATGEFVFIPEGTFTTGVYELAAVATDEFGAQSEPSEKIRIAVQQPGFLRVGSLIVSVLSVIIPLLVLAGVLIASVWYLIVYARRFRKRVRIESAEALQMLRREFADLQIMLRQQESALQASRKTKKLTKAEAAMIELFDRSLQSSQLKVEKEIADITELTKKKDKSQI